LRIADYAAAPRKATEDVGIIDHRKRMLQSFLNRLAQHPILRRDHVVHRFLTGDASWVISPLIYLLTIQNEVLHSPPISLLPKNILKAPPVNPASADGDQRYKGMLLPKPSGKLKV
jgi:sorting nexin-41/42